MQKFEPLVVREEQNVLIVTISRPEALNALNNAVMKSFVMLLNWLAEAEQAGNSPRAMIITGAGEKAFVAGADIREFEAMNPKAATEFAMLGQGLFTRLETLSIPVLAAVNGFALGGGLELALACDFIYASENAKFGMPECTLGLMPGYGGTVRLPRRVGPARAREMALTGAPITAQEALAIGLVNRLVPPAELIAKTLETAKTIASRAPLAIGKIKESIHKGMNLDEEKANGLEARLFGELFGSQDQKEGVRAFLEKRKPSFNGK